MANPQLHPLEVNPKTGEPFLRLLAHKNIILTPPRLSDAPFIISILNDERVYPWLSSPPYPYLPGVLGSLKAPGRASQGTPRRDPNDPDIWTAGDYLAPSHHRQGIMSDAFNTLLRQWGIPRMGVRRMVVTTLEGNKGSVRVFEKLGFKFRKTINDAIDVRGTKRGVHMLEWTLEDEGNK
ncbi:N-acetyltransferase domain-containing protein [Mycena venus]|uniref:N-acetyltransferase domain-containing protein n=1 Tax=Mycena venus TaxID=2733690 RepID=A0A8H7CRC1_9AGAR|nr:N-acetyltransferase domain-containing protein [Mycena venus]